MKDSIRLGCFAAFWGDTRSAVRDILDGADVDYLVSDYLSEITMALLSRSKAKDPEGGYIVDFVDTVGPALEDVVARGIKIVTNAGGLNPEACARALERTARDRGVEVRVAAVVGDDLLSRSEEVFGDTRRDLVTGAPVPNGLGSANAYLGARPIAVALARGADVVITGRCVDAAVVLGPLMHEFGWRDDDYGLLAAGALVGHIVECGPQATGGNVTDWRDVPGWDRMGFPVAECFPDGTAVIGKPAGTGGLVSPHTVAEQVLYEIGDPGAYLLPDVICDWREVTLTAAGPDRVRVEGARGSAPTTTYKVTATRAEGYRALTTAMFAGVDAAGKAERMAEALINRTERLSKEAGAADLDETSIEVVGGGQLITGVSRSSATEAVVKIGVRSRDRAAVEIFSAEFASMALVAQGMTGVFAGRPRVAPSIAVYHLLADKALAPATVLIAGEEVGVDVAPGRAAATISTPELDDETERGRNAAATSDTVSVPLLAVARARSGDKGDLVNIGVIARRPEFERVLLEQLTTARIAAHFAHLTPSSVHRWRLPGLAAINVVLKDVLGGRGGTSTLRYDPQGKSYAAMLLALPVEVDRAWLDQGLLHSDAVLQIQTPAGECR